MDIQRFSVVGLCVLCIANVASAQIYTYKDAEGVQHLSNVREPNAKVDKVLRVPTFANSNRPENVKQLLSKPRFTKQSTLGKNPKVFAGKYPRPIGITLSGFGTAPAPAKSIPFRINEDNRRLYAPYIQAIAQQHRLDPALMHAVISAESAYNPKARSHANAQGLMQLIPATAKRFGVEDAYDPIQNMQGGAAYLRFLLDRFDNQLHLAIAGYNAGEGAVEKYKLTIPPYAETQAYVPRVLAFYQKYRQEMYGQ